MNDLALADRRISGRGTPESDWQAWPGWQLRPTPGPALVPSRLVVVAPHPDDETLAAGGLIQATAAAGRPVLVLAVTPGDGSHPGSQRWPRPRLVEQRRFERANALAQLGAADAVVELEVPDGAVGSHHGVIVDAVRAQLRPGDTVVTTWRYDGHPDHEATCEAVELALAGTGAILLEAPVWGWHWARPAQLPAEAVLFELTEAAQRAKQRAIAEFQSQLEPDPATGAEPILPSWALLRWQRRHEVFFRA